MKRVSEIVNRDDKYLVHKEERDEDDNWSKEDRPSKDMRQVDMRVDCQYQSDPRQNGVTARRTEIYCGEENFTDPF